MFGLLGEKLGHSFSKEIHESINDYKYNLIEVSKEDYHKEEEHCVNHACWSEPSEECVPEALLTDLSCYKQFDCRRK